MTLMSRLDVTSVPRRDTICTPDFLTILTPISSATNPESSDETSDSAGVMLISATARQWSVILSRGYFVILNNEDLWVPT